MAEIPTQILREYDIRGTYGKSLFDATAHEIGLRLGSCFRSRGLTSVALGRDGRLSSPSLCENLIQGLRETGCNVTYVGIGPTPMLYFATKELETDAGVMITGSHNPGDDNGFKLLTKDGPFFGDDIRALANQKVILAAQLGDYEEVSIEQVYIKRLLKDYKPASTPLTVVWDPGNGAAGAVVTELCKHLSGKHIILNAEIDGTFPSHHPDPSEPHNLEQLIDAVKTHSAHVGIAFDGDGDRIGVVDSQGRILFGDQLMVLYARAVLEEFPGSTIIADVKASQTLFDDITAHGGNALMWRTGHSLIKVKMAETGAKLAGEMSGHTFFADHYYGFDDAIYSAIRLLNILNSINITDFMDSLPKLHSTPEMRIPSTDETKFTIIQTVEEKLQALGADVNTVDGVRVNSTDGWWLLRASNTQPVLVARFESTTQAGLNNLKATFWCVTGLSI